MSRIEDNISIENARIIFRNFSGKKTQYNREGNRNFNVIIDDPVLAQKLTDDGWNIRVREPRDEGELPEYRLQVTVSFDFHPPKVIMVTKKAQVQLTADNISNLDYADIKFVDVTIRPYNWEVNGNRGVKAYLKTMYVVLEEDEFADKYTVD